MIIFILRRLISVLRSARREHGIATVLTISNAISLLLSLGGMLALSLVFALEDIGRLGIISSMAMLFAPFITFRLDLAFERLRPKLRIGLIMLVHLWALIVCVGIAALGSGIAQFSEEFQVSDAIYLSAIVFLFCSHSLIWSWLVGQRRLIHSAILQMSRSFLSAVLPLLLYLILPAGHALLLGTALSQAPAVLFLLGTTGWSLQTMVRAGRSVWLLQSHLFLGSSFPIFLNMLSVYGGPPLISLLFSPREAGIFWLILRLVLTPAALLTDPIRRSIYAKHPQISRLYHKDLDRYRKFFRLTCTVGIIFATAAFILQPYVLEFVPLNLRDLYSSLVVACLWVCILIGNSPLYGLTPILRMNVMPTIVELIAIFVRTLAVFAGFIYNSFYLSVLFFFLSMLLINFCWGRFIYRNLARRITTMP